MVTGEFGNRNSLNFCCATQSELQIRTDAYDPTLKLPANKETR
jgi:hypothetical protein